MQKSLSRYWLLLGVSALAIAGLFALVLVVARAPESSSIGLFDKLFYKSLVVHVDLSVLVWFLCIACLMWSLLVSGTRQIWPFLEEAALLCFASGTLAIALSSLDPHGQALMSNYIPVITSPVFFLGLALLLCGILLMLLRLLTASTWSTYFDKPMQFGIFSAGLIALIAVAAFIWSSMQLSVESIGAGQVYYDMLFWGGGHVLQLVHTQVLLVCWLLLVKALLPGRQWSPKLLNMLFAIGLAVACITPLPYLFMGASTQEFRDFFTQSMIAAGGIAPVLMAFIIIRMLLSGTCARNALWASLVMSLLLFLYGGVLGEMIRGQNVVIPAHYHGSIVGVTLALMGVAYLLLPQFGYRDVSGWKLAFLQPFIYGGGQLLHISGLAWSGGYGVLRKTPGGLEGVSASVKAAMGMMGIGGLIAIIGGFLFIIVVGKAVSLRLPPHAKY